MVLGKWNIYMQKLKIKPPTLHHIQILIQNGLYGPSLVVQW